MTTASAGATTFGSIAGGFVRVEVADLAQAWQACRKRPLGIGAFRAWLAAREMVARRQGVGPGRSPLYGVAELATLLGVTERTAAASVHRLVAAGLLIWSESAIGFPAPPDRGRSDALADAIGGGEGSVTIPRRMLRFLAQGARAALIATALGVLLRCVSRRRSGFGARGRLAASWVAQAFGVDIRRVKQARAELIRLGWLAREPGPAWATNRWGASWIVDLAWSGPRDVCHPQPAPDGARLPPPCLDPDPLREEEHPDPAVRGPFGASLAEEGTDRRSAISAPAPIEPAKPSPPAPNLRAIRAEDLTETDRTLELHRQAVERGAITESERDRIRFVAAAEHARAVGKANPPGLLARIVGHGWWHLLTQGDEDRAARRLREHERDTAPPLASWRSFVVATVVPSSPSPPTPAPRRSIDPKSQPREPTALSDLLTRMANRPILSFEP